MEKKMYSYLCGNQGVEISDIYVTFARPLVAASEMPHGYRTSPIPVRDGEPWDSSFFTDEETEARLGGTCLWSLTWLGAEPSWACGVCLLTPSPLNDIVLPIHLPSTCWAFAMYVIVWVILMH